MKKIMLILLFLISILYDRCYPSWLKTSFEDNLQVSVLANDSLNVIISGTNIGIYTSYDSGINWNYWHFVPNNVNKIKSYIHYLINKPITYVCYDHLICDIIASGLETFGKMNKIHPTSICFFKDDINHFVSAIGSVNTGGVLTMDYSLEIGWRSLNTGLPIENDSIKALDIIAKNDTLFVALNNGLYYSTDEAESWFPVSYFDGLEVDKFVLNTKNDLYFIVSGTSEKSGLYKNNIKIFNEVLPLSAVAVNRNDDVFVSSNIRGKGVFWTSDGGTDWQEIYDGLDSCEITALICDLDGYIYAGTNRQGIYKSLKSTTKVEEITKSELFILPNPFSEKTRISVNLEEPTYAKITVYNSLGYVIDVLAEGYLSDGTHEFTFDGSALASGTYYYVLQANGKVETGKLVLIK
ncbi:T9SS C-terminal target domain-containing protein [Bacteroidetes/Chlorobi group bacterium ChocPot_Mid]|nr:MAG: T9SS C-terminal target domain-containing protein [Bacteroidetes/Chlorobi group bacterium ChocPot_Mid]